MKKVWKWILGIMIVLLVVAIPVAVYRSLAVNNETGNFTQQSQSGYWNGPMMRGFDRNSQNDDWQRQGMMGGFGNREFPRQGMMGGRGFGHMGGAFFGFNPVLMVFGGLLRLIPLMLFGLLLYGVYVFGKRAGARTTLAPAPVSTEAVPPVADSEEKPAE
jgi:hypothetical protein